MADAHDFVIENGRLIKYVGPGGDVIIPGGITSIGISAFAGCKNLTSVTIPEGVTCIGDNAFLLCENLTSVTIPKGVTSIGEYAFRGCGSLASVTIPESVTSIGEWAFAACTSLTSMTIPESVTSIKEMTFYGCASLTGVTIPGSVASIGKSAFFLCRSLTGVTLPEGMTSIREGAFSGCESLMSVTIPESVTSIGEDAFRGCENLTSVALLGGVTSIADCAFDGCKSLKTITIPESVTSIGRSAFEGCGSLTSMTLPEGVMSIGESAFEGCRSLTHVTIPKGVTSIEERTFAGCESLTGVAIPEGMTSIGEGAFSGCESLTSVTLPEGVTSIGMWTFSGCRSLTSVVIPESVTSIGMDAFEGCESLKMDHDGLIGSKLRFGKYTWTIIDWKAEGCMLICDTHGYDAVWPDRGLGSYEWLTAEFLKSSFSEEESACIVRESCRVDDLHDKRPGAFILVKDELVKRGAPIDDGQTLDGEIWGYDEGTATDIKYLRPAIWIDFALADRALPGWRELADLLVCSYSDDVPYNILCPVRFEKKLRGNYSLAVGELLKTLECASENARRHYYEQIYEVLYDMARNNDAVSINRVFALCPDLEPQGYYAYDQMLPLGEAIDNEAYDAIAALLDNGCNIDIATTGPRETIELANELDEPERMVIFLVERGATVQFSDILDIWVRSGDTELAKKVIGMVAPANIQQYLECARAFYEDKSIYGYGSLGEKERDAFRDMAAYFTQTSALSEEEEFDSNMTAQVRS